MVKDRIITLGVVCASAAAFAYVTPLAGPASATTAAWYAAPGGVSTGSCPQSAPCEIAYAVHNPPNGAEVIIESGSYGSVDAPLMEDINDGGAHLNIHGEAGHPAPTINLGGTHVFAINGSTLSYVSIVSNGNGALLMGDGKATRVRVKNTADNGIACEFSPYLSTPNPTLTDSICLASGKAGHAVDDSATVSFAEGTTHATIENVTAEATGLSGVGLWDSCTVSGAGSQALLLIHATNDMFYGQDGGVVADAQTDGEGANVILRNSVANSWREQGGGDADVDLETPGDSHAVPRFVDAPHGNYDERPGSPTIDHGRVISGAPSKDFRGRTRDLGTAPDIGAYEHAERAQMNGLAADSIGRMTVKLSVFVKGEGSPTTLSATIYRNGRRVESMQNPHRITHNALAHFTLHFLHPHTSYRVQVVGTNLGGTAKTAKKPFTTKP